MFNVIFSVISYQVLALKDHSVIGITPELPQPIIGSPRELGAAAGGAVLGMAIGPYGRNLPIGENPVTDLRRQ